MNKYKFPGCIDLFLAFEDAMNLSASKQGTSGVKRVETGGKAGLHQIELNIDIIVELIQYKIKK